MWIKINGQWVYRPDTYTGYKPNPKETDKFLNKLAKFGREPDGKKIAGKNFKKDEKKVVLLYPYLFKAFPNWKSGAQGIGNCVSYSGSNCVDHVIGVQIYLKKLPERAIARLCIAAGYGFARVEVSNNGEPDHGPDGTWNSAFAQGVLEFGTLHRLSYLDGQQNLKEYSVARNKEWGEWGVPDELEPIAREHIIQDVTEVNDFDTAVQFIQNGYPVHNSHQYNPTCFTRDSNGYYQTGEGYAHAMNYIGVRWEPYPALLKANTGWANAPITGPSWPNDIPKTMKIVVWWEKEETVTQVLRSGDNFSYAQYKGFPAQDLPDYGFEEYL